MGDGVPPLATAASSSRAQRDAWLWSANVTPVAGVLLLPAQHSVTQVAPNTVSMAIQTNKPDTKEL